MEVLTIDHKYLEEVTHQHSCGLENIYIELTEVARLELLGQRHGAAV